jgi:ATP-binding cassette subfamily F protein uup
MALITMQNICWGLGEAPLIEDASFQIEPGQRICLLGRNGAGKSTLLKLIEGVLDADSGDLWRQQGLTVSALRQELPAETGGTVFEVAAKGCGELGRTLAAHHRLASTADHSDDPEAVLKLEKLRQRLDVHDGWPLSQQIHQALSQIGIDPNLQFEHLSAGMKRRALFGRAIAGNPDLLLLDEPTNHLDIETIVTIEAYILRYVKTVLFVSHDRAFVQRLANRVLELDRGRLNAYACDYKTYLKRSLADKNSDQKQQQRFDKKLSQEEAWIRQGVKARRARNEGRVRALIKMRQAYRQRRQTVGNVRLQIQQAERTGKMVIEANAIHHAYDGKPYISGLSTVIMRGDKIGLIGPNGSGKSTLLKILLKQMAPDRGNVRHGTQLQVAYFDQLRHQLEPDKSVAQNIAEGNDFIVFNNRKRHVISYLNDFLFTPERCRTPVHILSGGETNRLLLAKLFTRPANLLVLDEPTNDLDVETLELLEELLLEYSGTLLLVSHDRQFLNNVVTATLAFEGNGLIRAYPGGYDDWLEQRPQPEAPPKNKKPIDPRPETKAVPGKPRKLSYNEQRELEALPNRIETMESERQALFDTVSDPDFYKKQKDDIAAIRSRLQTLEREIALAYDRWEVLER